ncbi:MAG: helix-turn-helix domain-containing protein [Oscillospiraceae bacterium]|nr:helix-turn-helix domain-containing protein [Oscillospiraceae bacterium]
MDYPSYELIVAAVGGDEDAMEKILRHYEPMIEAESGGNQMIRQQITEALREAILQYDLNSPEKNEEYLNTHYPDQSDLE